VEQRGQTPLFHAVLFDYGDTLHRFRWDDGAYRVGAQALLESLGETEVTAAAVEQVFWPALDVALGAAEPREIDFRALMGEVLAAVGVEASGRRLDAAVAVQHHAWDDRRSTLPGIPELLDELRRRGLRTGLVSNAFDPPGLLHDDLRTLGLAERLDVAVFSSEVGWRKPHPAIFAAALDRLALEPERCLFVGDRLDTDVAGAHAAGMATCLALWAVSPPEEGIEGADHVAHTPAEVLEIAG